MEKKIAVGLVLLSYIKTEYIFYRYRLYLIHCFYCLKFQKYLCLFTAYSSLPD